MSASQIPLGFYTHLNFAFSLIDPVTFQLSPMAPDVATLYDSLAALRGTQKSLEIWISIGKINVFSDKETSMD